MSFFAKKDNTITDNEHIEYLNILKKVLIKSINRKKNKFLKLDIAMLNDINLELEKYKK